MLDVDSVQDKLLDGHGQTKWVSKQLVHDSACGTISGHSLTGSANP
jgi:hypothetical protein